VKRYLSSSLLALACSLLMACGSGDFEDLDRALATARNRPAGVVEPLPAFAPLPPRSYLASGQRSPFHSPLLDVGSEMLGGSAVAAPDFSRQRSALEALPLASLRMVGSMLVDGQRWGLIEGGGRIFTVAVGDFVGQNYGRVSTVNELRIELLEKIPSGNGGWRLRPRSMVLKNAQP